MSFIPPAQCQPALSKAHLLQSPRGPGRASGAVDGTSSESQSKSRETHPQHVTWEVLIGTFFIFPYIGSNHPN